MAGQHTHEISPDVGPLFLWAVTLNTAYVVLEAAFGFGLGSLALLADAAHNLTDVGGLLLAWGAVVIARRRPTALHTYGLGRATVLAALANGIALLIGVGAIAREAIERISAPEPVAATTMIWVAAIGIAVNFGTALLFFKGRSRDINVGGAFLHMAADAAVSAGVVISSLVIVWTGWNVVDPIVAILIAAVVAWSAFGLFKSAVHLSLDGVPEGVDVRAVDAWLRTLPGVVDLHDLHVWALSTTLNALTVHLVMPAGQADDDFLDEVAHELETRFGIAHATLQVERGTRRDCHLANPEQP